MGKKNEDKKFQKIDEEWRVDMLGRSPEELHKEIVRVAMNMVALDAAKDEDEDLLSLQEQLATARAIYTEGRKESRIKLEFLRATLESKGADVASAADFLKKAATPDEDVVANVKASIAKAKKGLEVLTKDNNTVLTLESLVALDAKLAKT